MRAVAIDERVIAPADLSISLHRHNDDTAGGIRASGGEIVNRTGDPDHPVLTGGPATTIGDDRVISDHVMGFGLAKGDLGEKDQAQ